MPLERLGAARRQRRPGENILNKDYIVIKLRGKLFERRPLETFQHNYDCGGGP